MAEVLQRFKNFLGFGSGNTAPEVDEFEDDVDEEKASFADSEDEFTVVTKDRYRSVNNTASANVTRTARPVSSERSSARPERTERAASDDRSNEKSKVINMGMNSNLRVVLSRPNAYNNCEAICSHLRGQMTVVLNLEFVADASERRRIFDFVSGCSYALDCSVQRISELIYVIAPSNVDVLAEVTDEEEETSYSAY